MRTLGLKIFLIILILFPVSFGCEDENECLDLYVEPYFDIQDITFVEVISYFRNKVGTLNFVPVEQDYDNMVYPCDSLALSFMAPDSSLIFHSQHIIKPSFSLLPELMACNSNKPGYAGTRELIDKIYITSNYDFDETHNRNDNLSDIVEIFTYGKGGNSRWMPLTEYNLNSPYEAPKRFYIILKRKPTRSMIQQFVIKYYMLPGDGEATEYYVVTTPVLHVK